MAVRLSTSVIPGLPALIALTGLTVLTAAGLTACSSSGTVGANAAGGTVPGTAKSSTAAAATNTATSDPAPASGTDSSSAAPTDSATSSPSQDPSALASSLKTLNQLWTDQGCKAGLAGFSVYLYAQQQGPAQGIASIPNALPKIREGAQQTRKPEAAQAMNKLAADLLAVYTQAQQGQTPNRGPIKSDFQHMGDVCSQQQP